jgi:dihydroflavonol-4-reductase
MKKGDMQMGLAQHPAGGKKWQLVLIFSTLRSKFKRMNLVTGATGLIGSHLLYHLVSEGDIVKILVRNPERLAGIRRVFSYYTVDPDALMSQIIVAQGDLQDYHEVETALQGVTKVYHCGAIVSFAPSEREQVIENNRIATANVVNACLFHHITKLVHVSSTSATGEEKEGVLITETSEWKYSSKLSGYAISKYESEREAWRGEAEGLEVAIVNPAMVLGPGNWGESSTELIEKCDRGLKFYTTGVNAYVDVRDVAQVMIQLMDGEISGERFILASENITFQSLFNQICTALGRPTPAIRARRWMAELLWRIEHIRHLITGSPPLITRETARTAMQNHPYSSEKVQKALGFTFRPLPETIQWTCQCYLHDHAKKGV